jgi:hypothetical protein
MKKEVTSNMQGAKKKTSEEKIGNPKYARG